MILFLILILVSAFTNTADSKTLKTQREEIMREELSKTGNSSPHQKDIVDYAVSVQSWSLVQHALETGINPCYIAEEIAGKHLPLLEVAVKQCTDVPRLQALAAQYKCKADCIKILHRRNIDIDVPNANTGETPLHRASRNRDIGKVEQLVALNAQVLRKDKSGKTSVDHAMLQMKEFLNWNEQPAQQSALAQTFAALQKGTQVNILKPEQYEFYQEYRKLALTYGSRCDDEHVYCGTYRAYARLFQELKEAEKRHFK